MSIRDAQGCTLLDMTDKVQIHDREVTNTQLHDFCPYTWFYISLLQPAKLENGKFPSQRPILNASPCIIVHTNTVPRFRYSDREGLPVRLPIRRRAIRRRSTLRRTTPRTCAAVSTRRCESTINSAIACAVHRGTLCTAKVLAIRSSWASLQLFDDAC